MSVTTYLRLRHRLKHALVAMKNVPFRMSPAIFLSVEDPIISTRDLLLNG